MTPEEITALAREYAMVTHHGNTIAVDFAIETIRFLLRRYCLVDKEVARTAYQQAMEQGKHAEK